MKKPRLVANARRAWRWHSMQILFIIAVHEQLWAGLPLRVQEFIIARVPDTLEDWIITILAVAAMILRLRPQTEQNP